MGGRTGLVVIMCSDVPRTAFSSCWQLAEGPCDAVFSGIYRLQGGAPITVRSQPGELGRADAADYLVGQGEKLPLPHIVTPVVGYSPPVSPGRAVSKSQGNCLPASSLSPNFVYDHMENQTLLFFLKAGSQ